MAGQQRETLYLTGRWEFVPLIVGMNNTGTTDTDEVVVIAADDLKGWHEGRSSNQSRCGRTAE